MAISSSFIILRRDLENKEYIENIQEAYEFSNWDKESVFGKKPTKDDIPMYIPAKKFKYVNHFSKELFDELMSFEFNSSFSILINYLNMSQYDKRNTKDLSLNLVEEMLEAINYLINEKYDRQFEDNVLENDFIKMFGETFAPYYNFYNEDKLLFDEDYFTQKCILKRLKIIFDTYVALVTENSFEKAEYILLYTVY